MPLFLLWPSLIVLGLHLYLWRRLVRDTRLPRRPRWSASLVLALLGASVPATLAMYWMIGRTASRTMSALAFGWLGIVFYLVAVLLLWDVWQVARYVRKRWGGKRGEAPAAVREVSDAPAGVSPIAVAARAALEPRETRRVFVARAVAGSALVAAGGIGAFGVRSALWDITMPEVPVALPRLPRALDGFTIALMTDVHIGPLLDGRFLRQLAEQTNRAKPDLIAIAGDLVDGSVARIGPQVAELRRLNSRYGVAYVTGNHEYYTGANQWIHFLSELGLHVLLNERISVGDAHPRGAQFDIAGLPDFRAAHFGHIAADAQAATLGRDPERELVVLAHQPIQIRQISQIGAGLQLSGHTHGGQLNPFGAVTLVAQPYIAGLHRHQASGTQVYVSRGTGFWGPPMRVLAPAEITLLRLHSV